MARLPGSVRLTCTHSAPPERLAQLMGQGAACDDQLGAGHNLHNWWSGAKPNQLQWEGGAVWLVGWGNLIRLGQGFA